jgi:hypothetical protein
MKTTKPIEVIEKYKDKIYTQNGERNLRTVKSIAIEAGLIKPNVFRGWTFKFLYINGECVDPYGEASKEVETIYNVCCLLKTKAENRQAF